ncbi:MAG: hypothetical protein U0359_33980 [Byssovorax sp.]
MGTKQRRPEQAPHASRKLFTIYLAAGLLVLLVGGLQLALGQLVVGVGCLLFGGLFAFLGVYGRGVGVGVQRINMSLDRIGQGKLAEAEALLAEAEGQVKRGPNLRAIRIQRAMIALRRGEIDDAIRHADLAIEAPPSKLAAAVDRVQRQSAVGLRAFLRASRGDRDGARKDIAVVRADEQAPIQALGRAALAEAILLEAGGDRAGLRAHLARERAALLEGTSPRERAIVRAYQRMLNAPKDTVYRQAPPRDPPRGEGEEPPIADWVAKLAPAAAPFVRAPAPRRDQEAVPALGAPSAEARAAVKRARSEAEREGRKAFRQSAARRLGMLGAGAILVGALLATLDYARTVDPHDLDEVEPARALDMFALVQQIGGAIILSGLAVFVAMMVQARRQNRRLLADVPRALRGDEAALADLRALSVRGYDLIAAQAHRTLGQIALRRGDLDAALAELDKGLGRLSRAASRLAASDLLLPELCADRAFILAVRGRSEEAAAELEGLSPAYPFLSRARLRVRLIDRIQRGDLDGAARLVDREALDLPLDPRDELLADAVRVAARPEACGAGEVARVKEELKTQADLRRWMDAVAPEVLRAAEMAAESPAIDDDERARDHAAEEEARAEEETAAGKTARR